MFASSAPIIVATGIVTAIAGLTAFAAPVLLLRLVFHVKVTDRAIVFFVRHWGVLLAVVGALTAICLPIAEARGPVLIGAAIEKIVIVGLIFFGPLKRTLAMTAVAIADGAFAILYIAFVAGA